jgi:hypothetical protein
MVLDETQPSELLDYLDERLPQAGCDHTSDSTSDGG